MQIGIKFFLIFLIFLSFPASVQGAIKRIVSLNRPVMYIPSFYNERFLTLDGKKFPQIHDPVTYNQNINLLEANIKIRLVHDTFLSMIRLGAIAHLYSIQGLYDLSPKYESGSTVPGKNMLSSKQTSKDVDEIISFVQERDNISNDTKFIIFADLLHDPGISDKDVMKFIDFMNLPEDFIFTAKSLNVLNDNISLELFFKDELMEAEEQNGEITERTRALEKYAKEFNQKSVKTLIEDDQRLEKYNLTTFSHEIASSFRASLILKLIKEKRLNFKLQTQLGDYFMHELGHNIELTEEEWQETLSELSKDSRVDVNIQNYEGLTFLSYLIELGIEAPIRELVESYGGDVYLKDIYNRSVLQIASEHSRFSIADYLYQLAGNQLNEISYFNGFVTKNFESVILEPISYFDAQYILLPLVESIVNKYGNTSTAHQFIEDLENSLKLPIQDLEKYESIRAQLLQHVFLRGNLTTQILSAVRSGDVNFLQEVVSVKDLEVIDMYLKAQLNDKSTGRLVEISTTHMLIEAIRYNQPESVKFLLSKMDIDLFLNESRSVLLDPLSIALMTSYLIDYEDSEEREKNLKIVNLLLDEKKISTKAQSFLGLEPMQLAVLTGALEVVKRLQKEGIEPPEAEETILNTDITYSALASGKGFVGMAKYLEGLTKKRHGNLSNPCNVVFH